VTVLARILEVQWNFHVTVLPTLTVTSLGCILRSRVRTKSAVISTAPSYHKSTSLGFLKARPHFARRNPQATAGVGSAGLVIPARHLEAEPAGEALVAARLGAEHVLAVRAHDPQHARLDALDDLGRTEAPARA
jgi:hypothetical protein